MIRSTLLAATALAFGLALPAPALAQDEAFVGTISPVNADVSGQNPTGEVRIAREGDAYTIALEVDGLSPGMHLAHIHGFSESDPQEAACATQDADVNEDGLVDLIETRLVSGVTLIPLTDDPASLALQSESYPTASDAGEARFETEAEAAALEEALQAEFATPPALERRVVYIHGVPDDASLPSGVASLEGVPARVTLPVACAELAAE